MKSAWIITKSPGVRRPVDTSQAAIKRFIVSPVLKMKVYPTLSLAREDYTRIADSLSMFRSFSYRESSSFSLLKDLTVS